LSQGQDDPVVREIDVYLSNELADRIRLVQYPLQQADAPSMPVTGVRLKPRHNILQIDQEMPALPNRFYQSSEQNFSSMTTRTFESQTIPVETHLCLGKTHQLENGETVMYLVPLQSISQMRPTMSHIHGDGLLGDEPSHKGGDDGTTEDEKETKGILKPLTYQRKESERAAEIRKSSYSYKRSSEAGEEWERLDVVEPDSSEAEATLRKVFIHPEEPPRQVKHSSSKSKRETQKPETKYVSSLNYMSSTSRAEQKLPTLEPVTNNRKKIVARLTFLLRQGLPIPYSLLRAQLPVNLTEQQVFDALAVCAIMVRGNFCLHSRFVSLPRELQQARTFMLALLQSNGVIRRKCLESVFKSDKRVSSEKLYTLLKQIAKQTSQGWILRIEDDVAFVADHPTYCAMHQRFWDGVFSSSKYEELLQKYQEADQ
jgi:DNA-directed RNA polymerase-3 subunit RPC5